MSCNIEIKEIIPDDYESNTYVVSCNDTTIIFDAGASVEKLEEMLDGAMPSALFITHSHFDHILNIDEYVKRYNIPVYISTYGVERLGDENLNLSLSITGQVLRVINTNVIGINDCDKITIGDIVVECMHTPGHSDCSTTYVVGEYAIVGDVLFSNGIGRYDLFDGDYGRLFGSIKKIKRLPVAKYFPGHGKPF